MRSGRANSNCSYAAVAKRGPRCQELSWQHSCFRFGRIHDPVVWPLSTYAVFVTVTDDFGLYISSGTAGVPGDATDLWTIARAAREQVTRALEPRSLAMRASAMAALVAQNRTPESAYEAYRRRVSFGAVLSNLGQFSAVPGARQFRVVAIFPVLNAELEPVLAVATVEGRMNICVASNERMDISWVRSVLDRLGSELG
jgi:hypothetical protein